MKKRLLTEYISRRQGLNWVILRGGRRYICNKKDEIIHVLCPSVKGVTDMSLARVLNSGHAAGVTVTCDRI